MVNLSIVVSVYNEEQVLGQFYDELIRVIKSLDVSSEIVMVNDGSADRSREILHELAERDNRVKVISFSRNYGHEAAMIAGIDNCNGDVIICLDADLQHPPAVIPQIIDKYREGYDIVTMVRTDNPDSGWFKRFTSRAFYSILNNLSGEKFDVNASDFFMVSRRVANVLKTNFREQSRFLRGFIQLVGFRKTTLDYHAQSRAAGSTKYSIRHLFKYSFDVMLTFSNLPLKLGIITGVLVGLFGMSIGLWEIFMKIKGLTPPGYTTIVVLISFLFAIMFFIIGIIGEYIAVLFKEIKGRPIYIIEEVYTKDNKRP